MMIPELADDYSAFLKVDLTKELSTAKDSVEDMLTRLEEFQSLIQMVQTDGFLSVNSMTQEVLGRKQELKDMCERIDGLECLVSRVKRDVDTVESLLNSVEAETSSSEGALFKTLGSFFMKKPVLDLSSGSRAGLSPFTSPDIFSAEKAFSSPAEMHPSSSEPQS